MLDLVHDYRLRRWAATGLLLLGVTVAYYASAQVGLLLALVQGAVTPLWPATGIAVVCLLLWGIKAWPGITVGAFFVNLPLSQPILATALIAVGNTAAPVCAYLLLRRARFHLELDRLRDGLALVFLGAFAGMAVSATVGTAALVLVGAVPASDLWSVWSVWWTGDAMGVLVVVPFLLAVRSLRAMPSLSRWRWVEAAALLLGTLAALLFAMTQAHLLFLVFPFLVWAALRFQQAGAAPLALLVSTGAVLTAAHGTGPFADLPLLPTMVTLQAFNGSVALTTLLLAAITTERDKAQRTIERAVTQLADAVGQYKSGRAVLQGRLLDSVKAARRHARGAP